MISIYIHIPYCKKACYYCDFHFSAYLKNKAEFLKALEIEIIEAAKSISNNTVESIYIGGGTPSVLSYEEIAELFSTINKNYNINQEAEITFEANPDDLTKEYLQDLSRTQVNRLSIGIQSFNAEILKFLNRRHDEQQAKNCIRLAREAGFSNLTIDMIYGIPGLTLDDIANFIDFAAENDIPHISAYHLGIEKRTVFYRLMQQNKLQPIDEKDSFEQFTFISERLAALGYEHYEISNFCRNNKYSVHNTRYWQQKEYIGFGPSAHSFMNHKRFWNVRNNKQYIDNLLNGTGYENIELEELDEISSLNDYIITSLRTKWGTSIVYIDLTFGKNYAVQFIDKCKKFAQSGDLVSDNRKTVYLTQKGMFISDYILTELIF